MNGANMYLAGIAKAEACKFYHGNVMGAATNLHPIADLFGYTGTWTIDSWDNNWCAAFVYWCCINAGYELPIRYENEAVTCNFAGCIAWEQWAKLPEINCWVARGNPPQVSDIVLFDHICQGKPHDHIGIITHVGNAFIETAEGNFNNVSAIVTRPYDNVRGYVRLQEKGAKK
ncbi:MAG: CHAP domain-containing protein [Defluviitaleaceae bacterium]|nr:CHAP domain-containing protein [Defluviitaleaceae bacterium]